MKLSDAQVFLDGKFVPGGIDLMDGLRRAVSFGVPLAAAVLSATAAPARVIRREKELGALSPGRAADLVVLDKDLRLQAVYIDGVPVR